MRLTSVLLFSLVVLIASVAAQEGAAFVSSPLVQPPVTVTVPPNPPQEVFILPIAPAQQEATPPVEVPVVPVPDEIVVKVPEEKVVKVGDCVDGPLGRVRAGSAYAQTLLAGGAQRVPCTTSTRTTTTRTYQPPARQQYYKTPPPTTNTYTKQPTTSGQCVDGPLGRVRSGSAYAQVLLRGGAQLVPCAGTTTTRQTTTTYTAPRDTSVQCVSGPLGRVRANSAYAQVLIRGGAQLEPCTPGATATRQPAAPSTSTRRMCDASTGRPVFGSIYSGIMARQGRLVECASRATMDDGQSSSSSSSQMPAWAVALAVIGTILLVFLVVVMVQMFTLLRK